MDGNKFTSTGQPQGVVVPYTMERGVPVESSTSIAFWLADPLNYYYYYVVRACFLLSQPTHWVDMISVDIAVDGGCASPGIENGRRVTRGGNTRTDTDEEEQEACCVRTHHHSGLIYVEYAIAQTTPHQSVINAYKLFY